jgi:hypothetical protein
MSIPFSLGPGNSSLEGPTTMGLFLPSVGAAAAVYGERDNAARERYLSFLTSEDENYSAQPWFFSNQPLDDSAHSGSGAAGATVTATATSGAPVATDKGKGKNGGELVMLGTFGWLYLGAATLGSSLGITWC